MTAVRARRLGTSLLRETMVARAEMELASYDRLFPNQDFMPKGGFGNLIALPLQKKARARGNTEFVDRDLQPWPDPWRGLSQVRRLTPEELEALLDELPPVQVGLDGAMSPSRWGRTVPEPQAPESIRCVRCYEEDLTHLHLPRGILDRLESVVQEAGSRLDIEEARTTPDRVAMSLEEPLSPAQATAVRELLRHDESVLVAPPGSGKTRMACALIAARKTPALVLVHRKPLLDQWRLELQRCLGLQAREIGQLGGGRKRRSRVVDLAMLQSLRPEKAGSVFSDYGQVVIDECHHLPAVSFDGLIRTATARFVLGLTATPYRRDGLGELIMMRCGPIRHRLPENPAGDSMALQLVVRETGFDPELGDDARTAADAGSGCLILTEWREHLERLADLLEPMGSATVVLHGGVKKRERLARIAELNERATGEPLLVLATGALVGEGFDLPRLDTLVLAFPISFRGRVIQYAGRILRPHPNKATVTVYDYRDALVPVLARMQGRRQKTLQGVGFTIDDQSGWPLTAQPGGRPP